MFLAEGPVVVGEALDAGWDVTDVFLDQDAEGTVAAVAGRAEEDGAAVHPVSSAVMKAVGETQTPQGLVAIVREKKTTLADLPADVDLVTVLAEVRDPGNAGTLVRSAVAAGAQAVVFGDGAVDPFGGKTIRSAVGATFRTQIVRGVSTEELLAELHERDFLLIAADAGSSKAPEQVDFTTRVALVLGNEAHGLSSALASVVHVAVAIPMPGPVESLNVAVAGSILLFEIARQRREAARLSSQSHGA